ncbi:MAG TPA: phenylalanine--tRNA ligase subunit beta [Bacteroidales bacterium]|jgi:phenylalanyl-tRNA synthetase beta chain|nr:phenylalanine--tRNA ligase subunit beta [Bacteroidales bacterium]MBP7874183.1 phenylalanine--tRNA ligase subunit beta [Bacteroidales bacterium]MCZ2282722.1 phenylalanine--tRNA ligase subunit beta [Bacteroidales bacterium]HPX34164.1 phenylalanine--tRNA ligase subunit beta [Bacteroidales bacterium]HQB47654.1 phenylalanine--tRNA ligase subunit beta [Bacteroidales bacterium]
MKISYNWLKEYINIDLTPEEIAPILTNTGLEVESIEKFESIKGGLKGVVIGEVKTCEKHPGADKLSITTVEVGQGNILPIVCGAPNVAAGQKVLVATVGTMIHMKDKLFEIKKTTIRGEVSEGMICAEDELGLGNSHEGIVVLPDDAEVGLPANEYFSVEEDYVFEIGLTPNRSDAMSHIGVARDLAAALNLQKKCDLIKLIKPNDSAFRPDNNDYPISVIIEDAKACPRYSGVTITGVEVKESPEWLKNRLKAIGLRPINNLVDISNFILHETGHPNHFFDADKITGKKIIVKKEPKGTKFTTLDEVKRELSGEDLMICDEEKGMCMAGVFGGLYAGVSESTKNIFIESAHFDSKTIRKTARYHGLNTDSSFRFERGTDPNATIYALKLAALMVKRIAGGTISSDIVDVYPNPIEKKIVELKYENVDCLIGQFIPRETIKDILIWLEMEIIDETDNSLMVEVPTFKADVDREADIIEDILRIYGYNNIAIPSQIRSSISYTKKPDREYLQNIISDFLSGNGYYEIMCNSLTKSEYADKLLIYETENNVKIQNPLSSDLNVMRQSLVTSGFEVISHNLKHKNLDLKLFEFGNVYSLIKTKPGAHPLKKYKENTHLTIFITGKTNNESWYQQQNEADFFFLKNTVFNILKRLNLNEKRFKNENISNELFESGIRMFLNDKSTIEFGVVNRRILNYFEIKQSVIMADLHWDNIIHEMRNHKITYKPIPKFPEVRRDLALVVDQNIEFETLKTLAFEAEKDLLKEVILFDVYEGEKIVKGKKSYAIGFFLQDDHKTLTDKTIEKTMAKIFALIQKQTNALLR